MSDIALNKNTVLSEMNGCNITYGNIVDALYKVGIKRGDTICVHSELLKFGIFKLPREEYMQAYIDALLEVIGEEGTLLMPTFSYSFCKGEIYDIENTKDKKKQAINCAKHNVKKDEIENLYNRPENDPDDDSNDSNTTRYRNK